MFATHIRVRYDDIERFASYFETSDKYIISKEYKPDNTHLHALVYLSEDQISSRFKKFRPDFLKHFNIQGNKMYSIKLAKEEESLKRYILKESDEVKYKGFTQEEIELYKEQSYKKFKKEDFASELESLRLKFLTPERLIDGSLDLSYRSTQWLFEQLIELKIKYNQKINKGHLDMIVLQFYCQQTKSNLTQVSREFNKEFEIRYLGFPRYNI